MTARRTLIGVAVAIAGICLTALPSAATPSTPQGSGISDTVLRGSAPPDSALEAMTTRLASELRCPVCQGNSIQDSPSELAQEMRNLIRDQLRAGKSPDEVRTYFEDKYGEWIRLAPRPEGLNLVVYLVPFLAIGLGSVVVWRTVKKWTAPS